MSISKYELTKKLGKALGTTTVEKYKKEISEYLDQIKGVDEKLAYEMVQRYVLNLNNKKNKNGLQKTK